MTKDIAGASPVERELGLAPEPAAWDYYHKRLMGAPGETRHHMYWTDDYRGSDGKVTADLTWLLDAARAGKQYVESPIWVRPMYYVEQVHALVAAERERCAQIVDNMVRAVDGADALAAIRGPNVELSGRQRQDARPGLAKMYRVPPDRAWWPAVGAPLERRVSHHCGCGALPMIAT